MLLSEPQSQGFVCEVWRYVDVLNIFRPAVYVFSGSRGVPTRGRVEHGNVWRPVRAHATPLSFQSPEGGVTMNASRPASCQRAASVSAARWPTPFSSRS